jgi:hypothetical protein
MIFTDSQLKSIIEKHSSEIPSGKSGLIGTVNNEGTQVAIVVHKSMGSGIITFQGAFQHNWSGDNSVGSSVIVTW